jgi:glycosyltransferase involved in cell wall biosynthesis
MASRVLVAVVVYNEEGNLGRVIADLREHCAYDVVVVDNASTDGSIAICKRLGVPYVAHCTNTGGGMGTVKTYFQYAYVHGYDVLCQFDGDGQHIAAHLPAIVDPVLDGRADYVIGSRFLEKKGFQSSAVRRIGINLFSYLTSRIIGQNVTDITSGFRAYGKPVIELFARHYKHELYDTSQLLLLAHYAGARILEVPVEMQPRLSGVSEHTPLRASLFPFLSALNIVGCLLQRKTLEQVRHAQNGH